MDALLRLCIAISKITDELQCDAFNPGNIAFNCVDRLQPSILASPPIV